MPDCLGQTTFLYAMKVSHLALLLIAIATMTMTSCVGISLFSGHDDAHDHHHHASTH